MKRALPWRFNTGSVENDDGAQSDVGNAHAAANKSGALEALLSDVARSGFPSSTGGDEDASDGEAL